MEARFTDTSEAGLCTVSRQHFFDSLTCFSTVPDVEVDVSEEMIRIVSPGVPNFLTNAVLRCHFSTDRTDHIIDETNVWFRSRGVVPYWRLCPGDLPADLEDRLVKRGLVLNDEQYAMALDLATLDVGGGVPSGLTIERVADAATMRQKNLMINMFGAGKTLGSLLLALFGSYGYHADSAWQHYIAEFNGEVVSCASVFYATGIAGVYMVATRPEARRRGFGRAVTLQGLLDARSRGYRVASLQSSKMGYNIYRSLGFQPCFTIKYYAPDS